MKVGIFYIKHTEPPPELGFNDAGVLMTFPSGKSVYIRGEEVDAKNESIALDGAKPKKGESVMNSHRLGR